MPNIKTEPDRSGQRVTSTQDETYSEPDEGVEIIDMEDISQMDWMAPESLRKELKEIVKKEPPASESQIPISNANVEETEDLIQHFARKADAEQGGAMHEESLYFFQFPAPFPSFVPKDDDSASLQAPPDENRLMATMCPPSSKKDPEASSTQRQEEASQVQSVDGIIGELVVYRSGAAKMKLANDILLDVVPATQPAFLQQAVYLNAERKQLIVLGEVNKRFSVCPDIDTLLTALEQADKSPSVPLKKEELTQMDET